MYKLNLFSWEQVPTTVLLIREDGVQSCIPFDPANTDYQTFKKEVLAGAELQDADENVMTATQAKDYVKELP
jgi:hypothetical protein